jgi:hypothetical protein
MKKITLLRAGLMVCGMASAEPFTASGPLRVGNCANLSEDVNITLTTGVVAGVSCTTARVAIATCHTSGMVKNRTVGTKTVNVDVTDPDTGVVTPTPTVLSCAIGAADPACAGTPVTGPTIANASTSRGTVTNSYTSVGACTAAAIPDTFAATVN